MKGLELGLPLNHRASLNLEMALLIALLVLAVVGSLTWMGPAIATQFNHAATALGVAGGTTSGPTVSQPPVDNGDGTWTIGPITGGAPPYQVVRSTQPDLSGPVVGIGTTPGPNYTVLPGDLLPGTNYIDIIDSGGIHLPTPNPNPIVITIPKDCYALQDEIAQASGRFINAGGEAWLILSHDDAETYLRPPYFMGDFALTARCPDDTSNFSFIAGEPFCANHPPRQTTDCAGYQTAIAQATYQWALAEVLPSTAKPIEPPSGLLGFYAKVLPYTSTGRWQCATGSYTYYRSMVPPTDPTGVFVYLGCDTHPAPDSAVKRYCFVNQIAIEAAARNYHADHGVYPPSIDSLSGGGYLVEPLTVCPTGTPYTLNPDGTVADCQGGSPLHGHF